MKEEDKIKKTIIDHPDGSITIKVDTPEGPASTTYKPDGTKIDQIPTPTGVTVIINFPNKKGGKK